ncbi:glycosyltransferase family 4 protein [Paradesertivirga mongoliensis]|uniref:Glycosyltransferase family 4 protein n=1 Tax=Paradesertivirga mongoliensis TaxID=2100740 RepID=A0ABW4ZJS5_9SPHI|nr:glycosyltransferase family 4 protein [Pedobacter mongoliensis]
MLIKKKRVLVLGQTPPPYGGQALMLQTLLEGEYKNAQLFHVRLDFSRDFDDMGSFKLYKFWSLFKAIFQTIFYRYYKSADILYYGPAGPNKLGMYRDMLLLAPVRLFFKKTILHTHAGGSSRLYADLNVIAKFFYRIAFFKPDVLITLTNFSHGDDVVLVPKAVFVVPNGIKDEYQFYKFVSTPKLDSKINLLYVGAMYEERGITELVYAVDIIRKRGVDVRLQMMGIFISNDFETKIRALIDKLGLDQYIVFLGTKVGEDKWGVFRDSDIFCFPTYVPSETFGLVLAEAMQFEIPVVATRWNGIPLVFEDGKDGLLIDIKNPQDLADKVEHLARNEKERIKMGQNGRKKYLDRYSIDTFRSKMDIVFSQV